MAAALIIGMAGLFEPKAYAGSYFYLRAKDGLSTITADPWEYATLEVVPSVSDRVLTYKWYAGGGYVNGTYTEPEEIPGADGPSLQVQVLSDSTSYMCKATDEDGFTGGSASFTVRATSGKSPEFFTLKAEEIVTKYDGYTGQDQVYGVVKIKAGESASFEVEPLFDEPENYSYSWSSASYVNSYQQGDTVNYTQTGTKLTIGDGQAKTGSVVCSVTYKGYTKNANFDLTVDSGLSLSQSFYDSLIVPGDNVTLKASASVDKGNVTYQWFDCIEALASDSPDALIEGATDSSYTTPPLSESKEYAVKATDDYGNMRISYYSLNIDSGLYAYVKGQPGVTEIDVFAQIGQPLTLEVEAGATRTADGAPIECHWSGVYGQQMETSADGLTATIQSLEKAGRYIFYCYDGFPKMYEGEGTKIVTFNVITNGFYASAESCYPEFIDQYFLYNVPEGASAVLGVTAYCDEGDLTFDWYHWDKNQYGNYMSKKIDGATGSTLNVDSCEVGRQPAYWCIVRDAYGNSRNIEFYTLPGPDPMQEVELKCTSHEMTRTADGTLEIRSIGGEKVTFDVDRPDGNPGYYDVKWESSDPHNYFCFYGADSWISADEKGSTIDFTVSISYGYNGEYGITSDPLVENVRIIAAPAGGFVLGDINGDTDISADDLTLLSRYVAGIEPIPDDSVKAACDVTGDGEVTADDLTKLSRKVAGIIQTLD